MNLVEDEFITLLLSKIKDTPENRKMLTQFASGLSVSQQNAITQKTLQKEVGQDAVQTQKTRHPVRNIPNQSTDIVLPQSLKTLETKGVHSNTEKGVPSFLELERYENICLLGKGGMGEVWKVRDRYLNRFVAMKIVQANVQNSSDGLNRFIEEARVNAQLQHPNIVPVHDIGVLDDGRYYFTMKEIQGQELCDVITDFHQNNEKSPSLYELMTIFHSVVDTIAFAHSHGVLHRDLKPSNILIGNFGEVLVLDWGIAKLMENTKSSESEIVSTQTIHTLYGSVTGTPIYMSPEQAESGTVLDERSDIYSLGAILYEILSGEPPYMGETAEEILYKVRNESPVPLESLFSKKSAERFNIENIPPELIAICNRSMSRNKEDRFSTAKEQAALIQDWLMGLRKTRKAEESFTKAQAVWQKMEHKKRLNKQRERKCAQYFSSILTLDDAWDVWNEYHEEKATIHTLSMKYKKLLEHTLFHDGNYQPAHIHMIRVLHEEHKLAVQKNDIHAQRRIKSQYKKHKKSISIPQSTLEKYSSFFEKNTRASFIMGRKKETEDILFALKRNVPVIGVTGYVGIGKKVLVQHVHQYLQPHSKRMISCSLHDTHDKSEFWQRICLTLNVQVRGQNPVHEVAAILNAQETILTLYDIDGYAKEVIQAIHSLQKETPTLTIIYTCVQQLSISKEYTQSLSPLSEFDSLIFFVQQAQQILPQFSINNSNKTKVFDICSRLGGLPLALEIASGHLRSLSLDDLHKRIVQNTLQKTQQDQILKQAFVLSWEHLSVNDQQLCVQLLIFPEDATYEALEQILISKEESVFDALKQLVYHNLVYKKTVNGTDRYGVLPSMRSFVQEKQILYSQEELFVRHAQYYASKINNRNLLLIEVRKVSKDDITKERSNFIVAAEHGSPVDAAKCALAAASILHLSGTLQQANKVIDYALRHSELPKELYWGLKIKKGRNLRLLGEIKTAAKILEDEITPPIPAKPQPEIILPFWESESKYSILEQLQTLEAYRRMELANIAYNRGDNDLAHHLYSSSMERFSSIHNQRGVALILNGLGNITIERGHAQKALSMYKEATIIAQDIQFLRHAGVCLSQQANIYREQEKYEKAILCYKESISTLKKSGDQSSFASVIGNLALLYSKMGDKENAIAKYKECIEVCVKKGNRKFEGINRGNLAAEMYAAGAYEESIDMFEQAILICKKVYPLAEISFQAGLALAYIKVDRRSQAKILVEKDASLLKKMHSEYMEYLYAKIQVYIELNEKDTARIIFSELEDFISKNPSLYRKEFQQKKTKLQQLLLD